MTLQEYRRRVVDLIKKRLGGRPKFAIDDFILEHSWQRKHRPSVCAISMIETAIEKEKERT